MAYSTFQSVTGPTGPEGVKAVGVIGVDGNIGPTGDTGPNSPHLIEYEYPYDNNRRKAKLVFSDLSFVVIDAVTGPNAFPTREQDRPTNQTTTDGLGSYTGLTAGAENIDSSGRVFLSQTSSGTGTTFQFRGLTAGGDLQLYVTDTEILIGGTGGATSGYVDRGATGEFLHLDPRWKAQGGSGTFFGASADNTGTGDSIKVKFRNVIDDVTDEFDSAFCGKVVHEDTPSNDNLREYILDVSSICRYVNGGVTYGNLCVNVTTEQQSDRIVILRTKVNDPEVTKKLRYPLWGATKVNFDEPLSGNVSFSDEGYGNTDERRQIELFNTPYINEEEGYPSGDGVQSNIHPQTWDISDSGDPIPCPTETAIIYDSGCKSNEEFVGEKFRGKEFCTAGPLKIEGYTAASYCLQITQDMFESENVLDPWFGKIRMVVMPSCDPDQQGSDVDTSAAYGFKLSCQSVCGCEHNQNQCCNNTCGSGRTSIETVTGRINLDITDTNFFQVKAPFQIAGITWSYEQRPGLSLAADDGLDYAEMKNITIVVEGGPENIAFPDNVFFAGTPKFTNGIDILNLASVDNGKTWYATMTGYGWDIDIFNSNSLGSCCTNLSCIDFVNSDYCDSIGGSFEQSVACANRTDDVCGAGEQGACCTGIGDITVESVCDRTDDNGDPIADNCFCAENPGECEVAGNEIDIPDVIFRTLYSCMTSECGQKRDAENCCEPVGGGEDCRTCTQEIGSCCIPNPDGVSHVCITTTNGCQRGICEQMAQDYLTVWSPGSCSTRTEGPCARTNPKKKCCQSCLADGDCIEIFGDPLPDNSGLCPDGIVDDCSQCEGSRTLTSVARPVCLTPATALSCNLINGYFVPEESVIPPQIPCDVCAEIDACEPFRFGTCCDTFSGTCFGTGLTEIQCDAFGQVAQWTPDVEDCDICCPQKEYRGACCLCVDECIDNITPQQCGELRGTFMGDESQCSDIDCAIAGSCDCVCEPGGCCNCESGAGRSPCCDNPNDPACCGDGDCCDENVECGCNTGKECCENGEPPGPNGCDDGPDDPDDPGIRPDNDSDGFDFRGFGGFGGGGGGPAPGSIDPRSDWLIGSCCFYGGNCHNFVNIKSTSDEVNDAQPRAEASCRGTFSTDPCFLTPCQETKFVGSCCCMYWTVNCGVDGEEFDPNDPNQNCEDCLVDDIKITCTDCEFDGDIAGFNRPWDSSSGPFKPDNYGNSDDIFIPGPTADKVRQPGIPYTTPSGLEIPFKWQDCCKNPGGCRAKPCSLEDRLGLESVNLYDHKDQKCEDGPFDTDCQSSCGSDGPYECFCRIVNDDEPRDNCNLGELQKANAICGRCNEPNQPCDNQPCFSNENPANQDTLDRVSQISSCKGCGCLPQPLATTCDGRDCQQYVFSSCRFVHDKTKMGANLDRDAVGTTCQGNLSPTPTGIPAIGINGSFANSTAGPDDSGGICDIRKGEVWGPSIDDPSASPVWDNPFSTINRGTQRSQSARQFRGINTNSSDLNISGRNDVYTIRYI